MSPWNPSLAPQSALLHSRRISSQTNISQLSRPKWNEENSPVKWARLSRPEGGGGCGKRGDFGRYKRQNSVTPCLISWMSALFSDRRRPNLSIPKQTIRSHIISLHFCLVYIRVPIMTIRQLDKGCFFLFNTKPSRGWIRHSRRTLISCG